jgi:2-polyprenyl-6-hydroxyphenyl methylase/3-demethylubiquinone-9 3-methyltransferase
MITLAEGLGMIPKGTHDWDKFLTPEELIPLVEAAGLKVGEMRGIAFSPTTGLHLSDDLALNYILTATRS